MDSIVIPVKTPGIIKKLYPNYVWDYYDKHEKKIYLTFDDGPIPEATEFVLEKLRQYNAKATFFCIGDNIRKHPDIFRQVLTEGHTVGNHTMNHLKAWENSKNSYLKNVLECEKAIQAHGNNNSTPQLFRPPYGQLSISKFNALKKMGYHIILWDILSKDWDSNITASTCIQNIIKNTKEGSIVVFHDSMKAFGNLSIVLPEILDYFSERGYVFDKIQVVSG